MNWAGNQEKLQNQNNHSLVSSSISLICKHVEYLWLVRSGISKLRLLRRFFWLDNFPASLGGRSTAERLISEFGSESFPGESEFFRQEVNAVTFFSTNLSLFSITISFGAHDSRNSIFDSSTITSLARELPILINLPFSSRLPDRTCVVNMLSMDLRRRSMLSCKQEVRKSSHSCRNPTSCGSFDRRWESSVTTWFAISFFILRLLPRLSKLTRNSGLLLRFLSCGGTSNLALLLCNRSVELELESSLILTNSFLERCRRKGARETKLLTAFKAFDRKDKWGIDVLSEPLDIPTRLLFLLDKLPTDS